MQRLYTQLALDKVEAFEDKVIKVEDDLQMKQRIDTIIQFLDEVQDTKQRLDTIRKTKKFFK